MKTALIYCWGILLFFGTPVLAQDESEPLLRGDHGIKASFLMTDVSYRNDAVFMGRKDSVAAPYMTPSVGLYHRSGLFADMTLSYLTGPEASRVDLAFLTAGYLFANDRWSGGVSGTTYFYNDESYNVQSEVVADITGIVGYDLKLVEISLYASGYFNRNSSPDIILGVMADHTFTAFNSKFFITPRLSMFAGSQYFYEAYYNTSRLGNRKGKGTVSGGAVNSTGTTVQLSEAKEFNVLNIEASLELNYFYKGFIFSFDPVWAFPQSSATLITEDDVIREDLKPVFYWSVGISYWIELGKGK